ncbi:MAG: PAS domain S-box protein [Dehalococcoidia bacterium]|nr:MAG: PAS domain S-box protein [Dehalococcoidia bacterium]
MVRESEKKCVEKSEKRLKEQPHALYERVPPVRKSRAVSKWTQEALLKRGHVTSAAIEEMPDSVMLVDLDGKVVYVNKAFEKLLGYRADELVGTSALDLPTYSGPRDREKAREVFKEVMEKGSAEHVDIGAINKAGEEIAISFAASAIKDAQGNPRTLVAVIRDITKRKRREEALQASEQHFRALVDNSLDGSAILNGDLTILYESPSAERILGYKPEELVGKGTLEFLHPDDAQNVSKTLDVLFKHPGQAVIMGVRFLHKDGSWRVIEGVVNNLLHDPMVNGIVVNYRDITERKHAQEALKQREKHFRVMIENSLDDIAILDRDGSIISQSPSVERVLGYGVGEHIGKRSFDFVHPDDMPDVAAAFARLVQNPGATFHGELRTQHKDGSWRILEVMIRNFLDDPVVGGVLANFRDVTERKMAEDERVEHAATLARAEELQLSRQRMVTMQESVRRDIAQQLHGSVQNKLIILLHRLAELERTASPTKLAEEIGDLRQKLAELLESQVRSISHRLYPSILRRGLVAALRSLEDQLEAALPIEMELDEELVQHERANPKLIPEQVRLAAYRIAEEALTNAVKNAKASRITMALGLSSQGWLRLTVQDNGQGFDSGSVSGGLGLLTMQDYAEVVGGRCVVHSARDEGTEVTAILPLARPGAEHPERALSLE